MTAHGPLQQTRLALSGLISPLQPDRRGHEPAGAPHPVRARLQVCDLGEGGAPQFATSVTGCVTLDSAVPTVALAALSGARTEDAAMRVVARKQVRFTRAIVPARSADRHFRVRPAMEPSAAGPVSLMRLGA